MAEFKRLFNTKIEHDFYTNGISKDFDIVPLSGTTSLLKDNRLLFKVDNTGFRVMYRSENGSDDPFLPFGDFDLTFAMVLKNKESFENITDLNTSSQTFEAGNLIYYHNAAQTDSALDYEIIDLLRPAVFTYQFPQTGGVPADNGEITITNEKGEDVTPTEPDPNTVKANENGFFQYPIDFNGLPAGLYTFTTTVNGSDSQSKRVYIDNQLVGQNVFGILKIHVVDSADFPDTRTYQAIFSRRETDWIYKMVLKTNTVSIGDDLGVVDDSGTYLFNRGDNEETNGIATAVFTSNSEIPYSELPNKDFRFVKNPGDSETIIVEGLSNPPLLIVSANGTDFSQSVIYITV